MLTEFYLFVGQDQCLEIILTAMDPRGSAVNASGEGSTMHLVECPEAKGYVEIKNHKLIFLGGGEKAGGGSAPGGRQPTRGKTPAAPWRWLRRNNPTEELCVHSSNRFRLGERIELGDH